MPDKDQRTPADADAETKKTGDSTDPSDGKDDKQSGEGDSPDAKKAKQGKTDEDTVTLSKKEFNELQAAKRIGKKRSRRQAQSDLSSGARFSFDSPPEPSEEELNIADEREYHKLQQGVLRTVLKSKDYQKVLESDKTLSRVLENNPLSLLDSQPIDADDALDQITDYLDELVESSKPDKSKDKKTEEKKKDETGGQPAPTPPVEVKKAEAKDQQRSLDDIAKDIAGKVTVDGKGL